MNCSNFEREKSKKVTQPINIEEENDTMKPIKKSSRKTLHKIRITGLSDQSQQKSFDL